MDVFIRELIDLPEESEGVSTFSVTLPAVLTDLPQLRHTYLRVLHPLMNNTQLRMYPYKRPAIRVTLLSLLSDDHIRHVSPTTKRLVERNLKADWCAALSPASADTEQLGAEAQLAKEMSAMALKGPAAELRLEEARIPTAVGSTLSVNAVADADLPHLRKRGASNSSLNPNKQGLMESPTIIQGPGFDTLHPHGHTQSQILSRSIDREYRSKRSSSLSSQEPMTASLEALPPKKVPPPRPPRLAKSMPSTPPELSSADEVKQEEPPHSGGGIRARFRRAPPPTPNRPKRTELQAGSQ